MSKEKVNKIFSSTYLWKQREFIDLMNHISFIISYQGQCVFNNVQAIFWSSIGITYAFIILLQNKSGTYLRERMRPTACLSQEHPTQSIVNMLSIRVLTQWELEGDQTGLMQLVNTWKIIEKVEKQSLLSKQPTIYTLKYTDSLLVPNIPWVHVSICK